LLREANEFAGRLETAIESVGVVEVERGLCGCWTAFCAKRSCGGGDAIDDFRTGNRKAGRGRAGLKLKADSKSEESPWPEGLPETPEACEDVGKVDGVDADDCRGLYEDCDRGGATEDPKERRWAVCSLVVDDRNIIMVEKKKKNSQRERKRRVKCRVGASNSSKRLEVSEYGRFCRAPDADWWIANG
jgi:hypothetical protein